jgi:nitroimidazol reductase NimA-like FMN-containing flavoprotein (pyridoxamine 5'-phosphate oxidase superfamily)
MIGAMTQEQIDRLLRSEMIGRIGCCSGSKVYVVPVTYAYDNGFIYAHSSEGRKVQMMRQNPNICFEVEQVANMSNWQSVIVQGTFEELIGEDASRAMELLMERFLPFMGMTSETLMPSHDGDPRAVHGSQYGNHTAVVYRIRVTEMTGRYETR